MLHHVEVFEKIVQDYPTKPVCEDHGVRTHDVFERISDEEYAEFYELVEDAAKLARKALDETNNSQSVTDWGELFGNEFPKSTIPPTVTKDKFTERNSPTHQIGSARFG